MTLESKFGGTGRAAAATGAVTDASNATAAKTDVQTVKIPSMRRFTKRLPARGIPPKTGPRYAAAQAIGNRRFPFRPTVSPGSTRSGRCPKKIRALEHIHDDLSTWQAAYQNIRSAR
jgi:hypothetical protein